MLLTLPVPFDPGYLNAPMRVMVGIGQITLGILGAVLGLFQRQRSRLRAVVGLLVSAAVVYLDGYAERIGPVEQGWHPLVCAIPLADGWPCVIAYLFAGRTRCLSSSLPGFLRVTELRQTGSRHGWLCRWCACLSCLPGPRLTLPKGCPSSSSPDMRELYARENEGWLGMDPESSYFPIWVEDHPHDMALAEAFMEGPARAASTQMFCHLTHRCCG